MLNIILAAFQILAAVVVPLFWIYFYKVETKNPENSEIYIAFEKSFPLPEFIFLVPCLVISAIGLITEQEYGYFFSIISGSCVIFVGLLDISFNLQNGVYKKDKSYVITEIIFNLFAMIFGPLFIIYGWMNI